MPTVCQKSSHFKDFLGWLLRIMDYNAAQRLSFYELLLSSNALKAEVVRFRRKHVTKQLSNVIRRTWAPYKTVFTLKDWASQYQLLSVINSSSLAYSRNVRPSGTAVAGYKTSRFKVSDLKWPELPVRTVWESWEQKGTKATDEEVG